MNTPFVDRHLLSVSQLNKEQVLHILNTAEAFFEVSKRPVRKVPTLRGKTVINAFFESSTRTRTSFELAGKRLSADVVNFSGSGSSLSKGESLLDTCKTLEAMQPDVVVIRHGASGAADFVSRRVATSVVNAGDGMHQHPTQALLDCFTLKRRMGNIAGKSVLICGDIAHSRVARSNIQLMQMLGAHVRVASPRTLLPAQIEQLGVTVFDRLEPALEGVDVVMALRIQKERLQGALLPSEREYSQRFCLTTQRLKLAAPNVVVMHPGPINRGLEISPDVADGASSLVLEQVEAGVAVRMAILYLLAGQVSE